MKFLIDQDVYESTVVYLMDLGHNILRARDVGLARAPDIELLRYAHDSGRILISRDKGFGQLVFLMEQPHWGVILLRMEPISINAVHQELARFIAQHAEDDMRYCFIVVESGYHRIRRSR